MAIQVFKPYFFTKDNQLKIVQIEFNELINGTMTVVIADNEMDYSQSRIQFSEYSLTDYEEEIKDIIRRIESFTNENSEEQLAIIIEMIESLPLIWWKEELLFYVSELRTALTVPVKIAQLNKETNLPQGNRIDQNNRVQDIEKDLSKYPFDNKEELIQNLTTIKEQLSSDDEIRKLGICLDQLEKDVQRFCDDGFDLAGYKVMGDRMFKLEKDLSMLVTSEQKAVLNKKANHVKQTISNLRGELYSLLRSDIKEVSELLNVLELLAIQPSLAVQDKSKLAQMVMKVPTDQLQKKQDIDNVIQNTATFCLIQEASTACELEEILLYYEWADYINLGKEGRSLVISRFFKDHATSIANYQSTAEMLVMLQPYIDQFNEQLATINTATTVEIMLEALKVFDIYEDNKLSSEKLKNAATHLLHLKEKRAFRTVNGVKNAFNQGLLMEKMEFSPSRSYVYMTKGNKTNRIQLKPGSGAIDDVKVSIITHGSETGVSDTITLL